MAEDGDSQIDQLYLVVAKIETMLIAHISKEDVLFEIFRRTLGIGVAVTGTLILTLFGVIGWLLTHQLPSLSQ